MCVTDSIRRMPLPSTLLFAALCSVVYPPPGSGSDENLLQHELAVADQALAETQAELDRVLKGFDQEVIAEVGRRLRELKRRRERIAAEMAETGRREVRAETTRLVRQREELRRRYEELERQVPAAAAEFDADPTPRRAARLSDLHLEMIKLKEDLDRAGRAARDSGPDPGQVDRRKENQ